jgi:hypothetical protein
LPRFNTAAPAAGMTMVVAVLANDDFKGVVGA